MKKNQKNLLFLAIFIASFFTYAKTLLAGSVLNLIARKKVAVIDMGENDGVSVGDRICFYGLGGGKKACGTVRRVKARKAYVRVKKSRYRKVRRGMEARIASGGGGGSFSKSDIKLFHIYGHVAPTTFKKLTFKPLETNAQPDTAWKQIGDASAAIFPSFGGELNIPMGGMAFGLGGRFRGRYFSSEADYDNQPQNFMETIIQENAFGGWLNLYYNNINLGGLYLQMGLGLDADISSLTISLTQKSDEGAENPVFDGTQTLTSLAVTSTNYLHIALGGGFGLILGLKLQMPVSGEASVMEGEPMVDTEVIKASGSLDPIEDLQASLGYQKSGFAFALHSGIILLF